MTQTDIPKRDLSDSSEWMVFGQVAEVLGVSGAWVSRLTKEGRLPYVQTLLGKLYCRAAVERLAEERERRTT